MRIPTLDEMTQRIIDNAKYVKDVSVSALADNIWRNPKIVEGARIIKEKKKELDAFVASQPVIGAPTDGRDIGGFNWGDIMNHLRDSAPKTQSEAAAQGMVMMGDMPVDVTGIGTLEAVGKNVVKDVAEAAIPAVRQAAGELGEDIANVFRAAKGKTAEDVVENLPNFRVKNDLPIKDAGGSKATLPKDEVFSAHKLDDGKYAIQDGETHIISKNQFENVKGNSVVAEAKPFGTDISGMQESIYGYKGETPRPGDPIVGKNVIGDRPPKFGQYQLQGATDYRETVHKVDGFEVKPDPDHFDVAASWHRSNIRTINGEKYYGIEEIQKAKHLDDVAGHPLSGNNYVRFELQSALKEAVDSGAKYFTWTTGEQQAARYSATKAAKRMSWATGPEVKSVDITLKSNGMEVGFDMLHDGTIVTVGGGLPESWFNKNVREVVPKEIADKMLGNESGKLTGDELKVGGQWASNLYDMQVKNEVQDLLGGKVEMKDLGLPVEDTATNIVYTNDAGKVMDLKPADAKVGMEVSASDMETANDYLIVKVRKSGKIDWVPVTWTSQVPTGEATLGKERFITIDGGRVYYPEDLVEQYDLIGTMSKANPVIELTPEVVARIKGEAPKITKKRFVNTNPLQK